MSFSDWLRYSLFILIEMFALDFYAPPSTITRSKFTSKFSPILIDLNWSREAIVFIRGETL